MNQGGKSASMAQAGCRQTGVGIRQSATKDLSPGSKDRVVQKVTVAENSGAVDTIPPGLCFHVRVDAVPRQALRDIVGAKAGACRHIGHEKVIGGAGLDPEIVEVQSPFAPQGAHGEGDALMNQAEFHERDMGAGCERVPLPEPGVRVGRCQVNFPLSIDLEMITEAQHEGTVADQGRQQLGDEVRFQEVVVIQVHQELALSLFPCEEFIGGRPDVGWMPDQSQAILRQCESLNNLTRTIGAAVLRYDDFHPGPGLVQGALDGKGKVLVPPIDADYNADQRACSRTYHGALLPNLVARSI